MRLAALTLVLAAVVVAAPAWAQSPRADGRGVHEPDDARRSPAAARRSTPDCRARRSARAAATAAATCACPCGIPAAAIHFAPPQSARRAVRARAAGRRRPARALLRAAVLRRRRDRAPHAPPAPTEWTPVMLDAPDRRRDVDHVSSGARRVRCRSGRHRRRLVLADRRPARHDDHAAAADSLTFGINHPLGGSFRCGFDGARARRPARARSRSPASPPGAHSAAGGRDRRLRAPDPSPATLAFTVAPPFAPPPTATGTACPTRATTVPPTPTPTRPTATRTASATPASSCPSGEHAADRRA